MPGPRCPNQRGAYRSRDEIPYATPNDNGNIAALPITLNSHSKLHNHGQRFVSAAMEHHVHMCFLHLIHSAVSLVRSKTFLWDRGGKNGTTCAAMASTGLREKESMVDRRRAPTPSYCKWTA